MVTHVNPCVTVSSMRAPVFKISQHSVPENSDHHGGGAEKSLLCCPQNVKRLLDRPFSSSLTASVLCVFTGRHGEYFDDITTLLREKLSVFTESLPEV